ncbi:MAG: DinB family protein [Rhodospirillaceae bacterium]
MSVAAHFQTLARYNAWANAKIYASVASLQEEDIARPRHAFFGSILGTLNHLLVGDIMWLNRLGEPASGEKKPAGLDDVLYEDFPELRRRRTAMDSHIIGVVDGMDPERINTGSIQYETLSLPGVKLETPVSLVLTHLFNHGTHHRGQVHDQLSQTTVAPPPLDLVFFLRDTPERNTAIGA